MSNKSSNIKLTEERFEKNARNSEIHNETPFEFIEKHGKPDMKDFVEIARKSLEKSEPIICKNCGFDKNRISGHIFVRSFEDGGRMIEEVRCKECGNVPDYIMMTDKIVKIIYRNFDGSKEYFDNLKKKLESHGYSVIRPLKNDSLSDTLEDMFVNNPEPSQEKPLSDDDIVKKFWNKYPNLETFKIREIVEEKQKQFEISNFATFLDINVKSSIKSA